MKALLLYKKSAYQYYKNLPSVTAKDLKLFHKTHKKHYESLKHVEHILKAKNIYYRKSMRGHVHSYKGFDFVITVGGDGTFLEAARYTTHQIILGVNSDESWSSGNFCACIAEEFEQQLNKILLKKAKIKEFSRLQLSCGKERILFLNDILVCHKHPASMVRYELKVNNISEFQRSSGLWVSTAMGSTGAIKSAGGKRIAKQSQEWQYKPRELYQGKNPPYQLKGGIMKHNAKVAIHSLMHNGRIYIDGSHFYIPFPIGLTAKISLSSKKLRMVV